MKVTISRKTFIVLLVALTLMLGVLLGDAIRKLTSIAFAASSSDYVVTTYGATGNGTTDDTTAIQNAINAAQTAGGGVVFFPKGNYKVTATLNVTGNNVQLEGTGKASKIFRTTSSGTVIKIGHATDLNLTTHNKVKNLSIDRSVAPASGSIGVFVERARFTTLDGVTVYNAGSGIAVGPVGVGGIPNQFTNIINCYILAGNSMIGASTFPDNGIIFNSGADFKMAMTFVEPTNRGVVMTGDSNGILLEQVTVINGGSYQYGIISDGTGFARIINNSIVENALQQQIYIGGTSKRVTVSNSWIGAGDMNGSRTGIQIEPTANKVTIANNRIGDQRAQGITSRGSDVIITGNQLEGNVNSSCACDSIQVMGGTHVIISNNRVESGGDRYGIGLYDNGGSALNNYIMTGNDVSLSAGGYFMGATGATYQVANNLG